MKLFQIQLRLRNVKYTMVIYQFQHTLTVRLVNLDKGLLKR